MRNRKRRRHWLKPNFTVCFLSLNILCFNDPDSANQAHPGTGLNGSQNLNYWPECSYPDSLKKDASCNDPDSVTRWMIWTHCMDRKPSINYLNAAILTACKTHPAMILILDQVLDLTGLHGSQNLNHWPEILWSWQLVVPIRAMFLILTGSCDQVNDRTGLHGSQNLNHWPEMQSQPDWACKTDLGNLSWKLWPSWMIFTGMNGSQNLNHWLFRYPDSL